MSQIEQFIAAQAIFSKLVSDIQQADWHKPTPCSEWDVRMLVNHLTGENLWMPPLFAGKTIAEVGDVYDGDVLKDEPKLAWQQSSLAAVAAIKQPDAAQRTIHLSFGDTSGAEYISQMVVDSVVHGWDLAAALGRGYDAPDELIQAAFDFLTPQAEGWRQAGAFGPKGQTVETDSILTRLIALTGRDIDWKPDR